jgi:hypothetical protein
MAYERAQITQKYVPKSGRIMDQVREVMRYHHYSIRTERACVDWIVQFIKFNSTRVWVRAAAKGSNNTGAWSDPVLAMVP